MNRHTDWSFLTYSEMSDMTCSALKKKNMILQCSVWSCLCYMQPSGGDVNCILSRVLLAGRENVLNLYSEKVETATKSAER